MSVGDHHARGHAADRFRFKSAVHSFLIHDGQVLLIRRANTGYRDGDYSIPAGHLEGGEEIIAAAIREIREEVGVDVAREDIAVVGVMHRLSEDERIDFFVAITRWVGEPTNCEPHRCDEVLWADVGALPDNVVPYVRRALQNYQQGRWFDSFGWA